jgi:phage/plasmid primase-like uncharacterized protein
MPRYDPAEVKQLARGRWAEILTTVAGIAAGDLDGQHHPCPRCGGKDRFRFTDQDGDGSAICNHCARRNCGDGFATVQWAAGIDFPTALARVAEFVGALPSANGKPAAAISIALVPGANALETAHLVKTELARLATSVPKGLDYRIVYDSSAFVEASVEEVVKTF